MKKLLKSIIIKVPFFGSLIEDINRNGQGVLSQERVFHHMVKLLVDGIVVYYLIQ